MSSLYERTVDLIRRNEYTYDQWERQLSLHMSLKWINAFKLAESKAKPTSGHIGIAFVADVASSEIADQYSFLEDFRGALGHLTRGGKLVNGQLC